MILKELRMSVGEMTKLTVNPLLIPEVSPPQTIHRSKSLRRGESAQSPAAVSKHPPEMSQSVFIENQAALDGASLDRVRVERLSKVMRRDAGNERPLAASQFWW
jgi:hypothetical protein